MAIPSNRFTEYGFITKHHRKTNYFVWTIYLSIYNQNETVPLYIQVIRLTSDKLKGAQVPLPKITLYN